jgi:hypothetical protein
MFVRSGIDVTRTPCDDSDIKQHPTGKSHVIPPLPLALKNEKKSIATTTTCYYCYSAFKYDYYKATSKTTIGIMLMGTDIEDILANERACRVRRLWRQGQTLI